MTKTATYIRNLPGEFTGEARLIVSATTAPGFPETYIFPATADGEIADWGELDGSYRGDLDHERALMNAGYTVVRGGAA